MSAFSCSHFDGCSAPLCTEDPASLRDCAWFPDEEVCLRRDHSDTPIVRAQKRIARATGKDFERGCFTVEMLAGITSIGKKTRGLDPEEPITPARVATWLSGFKGRKPLTDEQRAVLRARALKMRASQQGRNEPGGQGSKALETFGAEIVPVAGRARE